MRIPREEERLLTPSDVAELFKVNAKTVVRWANAGLLPSLKTPGGHRRFRESVVRELLAGIPMPSSGGES